MMIEADLEKTVVDRLTNALSSIDGVSVFGTWQPSEGVKQAEDENTDLVVAVKASPRIYETPTIPDAQIPVEVSLAARADQDFGGTAYLSASEAVSDALQEWQKKFAKAEADLTIADKFQFTGFALNGGDCGLDRDNAVWQFSQSFTVYGIIM